jgi:hypothetical protein
MVLLTTSVCYASSSGQSTPKVDIVCGPIPFGNALTKFLKPYIKKAVKELVKKNLINKTTGKKLSKTLIGCTTVSGLCKLAKEQLDAESYIGIAKSSTQWGYETFIMQDEISAQVKSNMKEYLESYKENSQYYDAN